MYTTTHNVVAGICRGVCFLLRQAKGHRWVEIWIPCKRHAGNAAHVRKMMKSSDGSVSLSVRNDVGVGAGVGVGVGVGVGFSVSVGVGVGAQH